MKRAFNRAILKRIAKYAFSDSLVAVFFNPFWLCRKSLYRAISTCAPTMGGVVLDFGCGTSPYKDLFINAKKYLGLEFDTPENRRSKHADYYYDGKTLPIENGTIDVILSTQTIEHIPNVKEIVHEWGRILAPEGQLVLTVPFMWPEHEVPFDFQRYTSHGIKLLLEDAGFEVTHHERLLCDCRAPAQLFIAWMYDSLVWHDRTPIIQLMTAVFIFATVCGVASLLAKLFPHNTNTYADNFILATKK